jgi:NADH:ubiquinone oxidoreductase subunit 2 (subunit N)
MMNAGIFGVLMLLPARAKRAWSGEVEPVPPATTAETFDDLAGQGRRHPVLGLAMAVSCFSLIGLPLTVGFFGKLYLIKPALDSKLYGLVVLTMINAAISAGYYLKIVGTMFLRTEPEGEQPLARMRGPFAIRTAVAISVFATLLFGAVFPATQVLVSQVVPATQIDGPSQNGTATASR